GVVSGEDAVNRRGHDHRPGRPRDFGDDAGSLRRLGVYYDNRRIRRETAWRASGRRRARLARGLRVPTGSEMTGVRVLAILGALGTPAVAARLLVRGRGRLAVRWWGLLAGVVCLVPLAAPWVLAGISHGLVIALVAILGGIVMIKTIDWFSRARAEDDLVRVWLALTFWPSLEIEEVGRRLPGVRRRLSVGLGRLATGTLRPSLGLAVAAVGPSLGVRGW